MKVKELKPLRDNEDDWEHIEVYILAVLRKKVFAPLLEEIGATTRLLSNARHDDLCEAIKKGKVQYAEGRFTGKFSSAISREIKKLGGKWDSRLECFRLIKSKLPVDVRAAIGVSYSRFQRMGEALSKILSEIDPKGLSESIDTSRLIDKTIWKVERGFQRQVKGVAIAPQLTKEEAARLSSEYTKNLQLYIQDFAKDEIEELRQRTMKNLASGFRVDTQIKHIQDSYGVTASKAKFLARQETGLLVTKLQQVRLQSAGLNEYKWVCVAGSPGHPVRPMHKKLDGTIQVWDNPPRVNEQGDRKHPRQDFGCRCYAIPVVRF
jgi:SPP1 gp7 family putative phage head morphogenesis protein